MTRVEIHVRGEGPDHRVTLTTPATPEEVLNEIRRVDGLAVLTGADGALTLVHVAYLGWLTLEPVADAA